MATHSLILHSLEVLNALKLELQFINKFPYIKMFHIQTSLKNANRFLNNALFILTAISFGSPWIIMFFAEL